MMWKPIRIVEQYKCIAQKCYAVVEFGNGVELRSHHLKFQKPPTHSDILEVADRVADTMNQDLVLEPIPVIAATRMAVVGSIKMSRLGYWLFCLRAAFKRWRRK